MERVGFFLYLLFIASWFLRLTARLPALGAVRFDLLLLCCILFIFLVFIDKKEIKGQKNPVYTRLLLLFVVILFLIPFCEWPGTVLNTGLQNFVKAIVFFFFTVWYVRTEDRVKALMVTFLSCQAVRVLEPLYLHLTQGYWGDRAYTGSSGEFMNRLSGGPYDIINPNGLAFVVLTIIPFLLYFYRQGLFWKLFSLIVGPAALYTLYLTGSRSGVLGLGFIFMVFVLQSKNKFLALIPVAALVIFALANVQGDFKDRYLSIVSNEAAHAGTAHGRLDGVLEDFKVGLRKPVAGHGLGTSLEANANFRGNPQVSHNLYVEVFQEIGGIGLLLFLSFIVRIFKNLRASATMAHGFLAQLRQGALIFAAMNVFFGLASYGLSSYEWYLLAAWSVIVYEQTHAVDGPSIAGKGLRAV
ncbi:MAG: O-antigen ligase family protein [Desulfobulbus oligotrophicus]|jgi:hypothetical protein|nr:O-antigen ligase family protein [Desulfobulbus oligotrophicus]